MSIVHLIRHGQVHNPDGVLYERLPGYHLSELGQRMAEVTADFLSAKPVIHLRCSPLERAQQSMIPIAAVFAGVEVVTDARVIEAGNVFAGQRMGSTGEAAKQPKNWRYLLNPLRPSWGEPYRDIAERTVAAILDAAAVAGTDGQAAIVSHQLPIWVARLRAEGRPLWHDPRKRQCTLSSVTSFHVQGGVITRIEYEEPAAALLPRGPHFGF